MMIKKLKFDGKKLKKRIEDLNIARYEVCLKLRKSDVTLGHWLNNKHEPKASDLMSLSKILDCKMEYFFT